MPAPRIDKSTVERMLLAYLKDPNPTHVARSCGVSWQTAKKYIIEGAPALGIGAFSAEARQLLRNGDKIVRLTEVTKEIRYQVEARDLSSYQDMLFSFESTTFECLALMRARVAREKEYFAKRDTAEANDAPQAMIDKIKKPSAVNMNDLKSISLALHELLNLKREFWDRLEIVRRTEVTETIGGSAAVEGIALATEAPVDFKHWQPHEVAVYIDSIEEGRDPVYPAWMEVTSPGVLLAKKDKSANPSTKKEAKKESPPEDSVMFPPAPENPTD